MNHYGYGKISVNNRRVGTHRLAWEITYGPIPGGLDVLHNCPGGDNPACCNPAHLWLGTQADNQRDMVAKGRHRAPRGERHRNAKLTEAQVLETRRLYAGGGFTMTALASRFGVHQTTVSLILAGRRWAHLKGAG